MALYDGFFDATQDETTGKYDRSYGPSDFTNYFANVIGSGVCIHGNPDSFKAEYEGGTLYLRPGYLFIQGYWLANKAGDGEANYKGYVVTLPAGMAGSMAVVANLNLGQRMIEIEVRPVSQAYPDALVLAIITATTAEDTRHNTDICGVIDTAGELSVKVEWAVNYIDTEIDSKLHQVEQDIAAQDAKLDAKIAEVQAVADSIVPPPVGSIKFSASQNVGAEWIKCDGSFVNEADYPDLVAALGKLTPSGDKFQIISVGEIGRKISNSAICGGKMWVFSYETQKLYGVDVNGAASVKEIPVTGGAGFENMVDPTKLRPIALSIVPLKASPGEYMLFLAQVIGPDFWSYANEANSSYIKQQFIGEDKFLLYGAKFTGNESEVTLTRPFLDISIPKDDSRIDGEVGAAIPYVVSKIVNGRETFFCIPYGPGRGIINEAINRCTGYVSWRLGEDNSAALSLIKYSQNRTTSSISEVLAFNKKNQDELVWINWTDKAIYSLPNGTFEREGFSGTSVPTFPTLTSTLAAGSSSMIIQVSSTADKLTFIPRNELTSGKTVNTGLSLPSSARTFPDAAAYLWGKDIFLIFVGTGIIFSRTLEEGDFGYLDTTSVLGIITQFGYLDYSQDEGTLYLLGQDTANKVKAAKIVLNTLYDYANDGAWLPMIAADGIPAWIKAKEADS